MLYERVRHFAFDKTKHISMVNGNKKKYLEDLEKESQVVTKILKSDCTKSPYTAKQFIKQFHKNLEDNEFQETPLSKKEIAKRKVIHEVATKSVVDFAKQDFIFTKAFSEARGDKVIYRTAECLLEMTDTPEQMMEVIDWCKQDPKAKNPETGNTYSEDIGNHFANMLNKAKQAVIELSSIDDPLQMASLYAKYGRILNGFTEMGGQNLEKIEEELGFKFPEGAIKDWKDNFQNSAMAISGFKSIIYAEANPLFPEMDMRDVKNIDGELISGHGMYITEKENKLFYYDSVGGMEDESTIHPPKGYYSNPFEGYAKSVSLVPTVSVGADLDSVTNTDKRLMKENASISLKFIARRFNKNYTIGDFTVNGENSAEMQNCHIRDAEGHELALDIASQQLAEGKKLFLLDPKGHYLTDLHADKNYMMGFVQTSAGPDKFKFKDLGEKTEKDALAKADKKLNSKMAKEIAKAEKKAKTPLEAKNATKRIRAEYIKKHDAMVKAEMEKSANKELKQNLKDLYKSFDKMTSKKAGDPENQHYNALTAKIKEAMKCNFSNKTELVEKLHSISESARDYLNANKGLDIPKDSNLENRIKNAQTAFTSFLNVQEKVNDFSNVTNKYLPKEERVVEVNNAPVVENRVNNLEQENLIQRVNEQVHELDNNEVVPPQQNNEENVNALEESQISEPRQEL